MSPFSNSPSYESNFPLWGVDPTLRNTALDLSKTLLLVRINSWDTQLAVPNDPRYARVEAKLRIGQAREGKGSNSAETVL
ncbi:hypothetical protein TNCV_1874591 [Trichonephila clavipes]|nr:hypothetical protein TNCV_1874591 [Trichonephila clavipes]